MRSDRLAAAERYESAFVPSILQEVAVRLADMADVRGGQAVLDVGSGTGVVARECQRRVGPEGRVTGLDISEEMLTVARRIAPDIAWVRGDAGALPFRDTTFDRVLSEFALMFFPDQVRSVAEMWRVLRAAGHLAVSVSGRLEDSPVNSALAELIRRRLGEEGGRPVEDIWTSGEESGLLDIFAEAGVDSAEVSTETGSTEYPSVVSFIEAEVRGWSPISELVDDRMLATLIDDALQEPAFAVEQDGRLRFESPYFVITATKPV